MPPKAFTFGWTSKWFRRKPCRHSDTRWHACCSKSNCTNAQSPNDGTSPRLWSLVNERSSFVGTVRSDCGIMQPPTWGHRLDTSALIVGFSSVAGSRQVDAFVVDVHARDTGFARSGRATFSRQTTPIFEKRCHPCQASRGCKTLLGWWDATQLPTPVVCGKASVGRGARWPNGNLPFAPQGSVPEPT